MNVEYSAMLDQVDDTYYEITRPAGSYDKPPLYTWIENQRVGSIFVERKLPSGYYLDLATNTCLTLDLNNDGVVNWEDLEIAKTNWEGPYPAQYSKYYEAFFEYYPQALGYYLVPWVGCATCDLNGDGVINAADLTIAKANWEIADPPRYASYYNAYSLYILTLS